MTHKYAVTNGVMTYRTNSKLDALRAGKAWIQSHGNRRVTVKESKTSRILWRWEAGKVIKSESKP